MVTIRDVAKHAGGSPATVSRVRNGLVGYSDGTRERVETAVKSLTYETDYLARGLKTRQTSVIGLLAPMVSDALASQVMQGVEEEAQEPAGLMPGWREKGGRPRHPVSPSASFYAPAVALSPQGAGP